MKINFRVDPGLIRDLSEGCVEKQSVQVKKPVAQLGPGKARHGLNRIQKAALESVRKDAEMQYALATAKKVGDLLVKRETEEVANVKAFAEELRGKYPTEGAAVPCQTEMEACVNCYEGGDVTKCGEVVDAYGACAADAWKEAMKSKAQAGPSEAHATA